MKYTLIIIVLLMASFGQDADAQVYLDSPQCFNIVNEASYSVYGEISTDKHILPSGAEEEHKYAFKLSASQTLNEKGYPTFKRQFCAKGPFYNGLKLRLKLRTLIPIFECMTAVNKGDIIIRSEEQQDGTAKTYAICRE